MKLSEKLIQLGFSQNQALVYKALIELGQCKAQAIIKKTNLHRNIVYEALEVLVEKRLAFKTSKGGVALFQLSDANTLVQDAKSQLSTAQEVAKEINSLRQESTHEIKLYEGIDGLKSIRQKALSDLQQETDESKKELLVMGAGVKITEDLYEKIFKKDDQKRATLGIPARMLFPQKISHFAQRINESPFTKTKLLPQSMQNPTVVDIWKDQVAFMLYDVEPFIISIKNQGLADSFRDYFEALWNQETSIIVGLPNVQLRFREKMLQLNAGEEYVVLGANYGVESKTVLTKWFIDYHTERTARKIKVKLLGFDNDQQKLIEEIIHGGDPKFTHTELRFLSDDFASPMQINIYPDSIMMVYWGLGEKAVAVEIHRKDIRESMMAYFTALWNMETKVYRGIEGMKMIMEASLDYAENWFIGGNGGIGRVMPEYWRDYNKRRIEKGVWWHDLVDNESHLEGIQVLPPGVKDYERCIEYKRLSEEVSSISVIFIYGNFVANIIWDAQPEPVAFVIENKYIAENYKKYFQYLWNQDAHIITGRENVEKLLHRKLDEMAPGETHYAYGGQYGEKNPDYFFRFWSDFNAKRNATGNKVQLIGFENIRKNLLRELQTGDPEMKNAEVRFLDQELLTPTLTMIYPDSAVMILWDYDEAMAIEITRESARNMLLQHFKSLWNIAKK